MVLKLTTLCRKKKWHLLDFSSWCFSLWVRVFMDMVEVGLMPMPLSMGVVMPLVQWVSLKINALSLIYKIRVYTSTK